MKLVIFPAGTEDLASTRLRVITPALEWVKDGVTILEGKQSVADVVLVQKRISSDLVDYCRKMRSQGTKIIYDLDDSGSILTRFGSASLIKEMMNVAHRVTVDTSGRRKQVMQEFKIRHVEVIPNPIDYFPTGPIDPVLRDSPRLRILWFGNGENLAMMDPYQSVLMDAAWQWVVVIDREYLPELTRQYPGIEGHAWNRNEFVSILRSCDLACLVHDQRDEAKYKSNNKMIAAIHWGLPTLVSNSAEYRRTAEECGVPQSLFQTVGELRDAIQHLRSQESRRDYLSRSQPIVWKNYAPSEIAQQWMKMVHAITPSEDRGRLQ